MPGIELGTRVSLYPQELIIQGSFLIWEWKFGEYLLKFEEEGNEAQKAKKKRSKGSKGNGRIGVPQEPGRRVMKRREAAQRNETWEPAIPTVVSGLDLQPASWFPASSAFPLDNSNETTTKCPSCVPNTSPQAGIHFDSCLVTFSITIAVPSLWNL